MYGIDIKQGILKPTENDIILSPKQEIEHLKRIVQQDTSFINKDKYFVRSVFGTIFSAMFFYLCCKQVYIRGKKEITREFLKLSPSYTEETRQILCLWDNFCQRELSEQEIETLIDFTKNIVENI